MKQKEVKKQEETKGIFDKQDLSKDNTNLIKQFKREVKYLKYPVLLKNTNISVRSILQFFYEYPPDKYLSLRLTNML